LKEPSTLKMRVLDKKMAIQYDLTIENLHSEPFGPSRQKSETGRNREGRDSPPVKSE